ncbi:MAG: glycosyltransferase [Candidatus Micrarchaeota archaeon]|nr:glycosyltransferase [Candidatus Micrarchaeota archaeon]
MSSSRIDASFIVPALNEEKYIERTLRSIKSQKTRLRFELIVADGKSSDRTLKIASKYADKIVVSPKSGIWAGRNEGAKKAKGRLLVFIDADTIIPPNYLDVVYQAMQDRRISGLSCAFKFDRHTNALRIIETLSNKYLHLLGRLGIGELQGFNCVIRKKDFMRVGGFPNKPLEDGAMARRLHKIGKVVFCPKTHVITSSRRMFKGGTISSIEYYANLEIMTHMPNSVLRKFLKYKKYIPYR